MTKEEMLKALSVDHEDYCMNWEQEDREAYTLEDDITTLWECRDEICPDWETDTFAASRMAGVYLGEISQEDYPLWVS